MVHLKPVRLCWVVAWHLPKFSRHDIWDRFETLALRPFATILQRHPGVKVNLHLSGPVLDRLESHQPDLLEMLQAMHTQGQLELLGGGYHAPAPNLVSSGDTQAQWSQLATRLEGLFGTPPRGGWIPESLWEPGFAKTLSVAGCHYLTLEDSLFETVGLRQAQLCRPYLLQYENRGLVALPCHRLWSQQIPWQPLRETLANFTQVSHRAEPQVICISQAGEAYGLPPGTYIQLYQEDRFLEWLRMLEKEGDWLKTSLLGEAAAGHWPQASLPSGSARERDAGTLSLPLQMDYTSAQTELQRRYDADRFTGYFRAGTWLGYLNRYAEASQLHKRMWRVRQRVEQLPLGQVREDALSLVHSAQDAALYWPWNSGGIEDPALRSAAHRALIQADAAVQSQQDETWPAAHRSDFNADGFDEVWMQSGEMAAFVVPGYGGSLAELDSVPDAHPWGATLRRRVHPVHKRFHGFPAIEDWHERRLFQDHFIPHTTGVADFAKGTFVEYGDFVDQPFEIGSIHHEPGHCRVCLWREGGLYMDGQRRPLRLDKEFVLDDTGMLTVNYRIENRHTLPVDVTFAVETNYTPPPASDEDAVLQWQAAGMTFSASESGNWDARAEFAFQHTLHGTLWEWKVEPAARLMHHPVETLCVRHGEPILVCQGGALLAAWMLNLNDGQAASFSLKTRFVA